VYWGEKRGEPLRPKNTTKDTKKGSEQREVGVKSSKEKGGKKQGESQTHKLSGVEPTLVTRRIWSNLRKGEKDT